MPRRAVSVPAAQVGLSTASVYPEPTSVGFELARRLGYDGVEVMVWTDPESQDVDQLVAMRDRTGIPVVALHAPCLVITQRVWGADPIAKLGRAADAAQRLGADTVVVHPPFRWQVAYAHGFARQLARLYDETGVRFAVENMFPLRLRGRDVSAHTPDWSPVDGDYRFLTLDLSHTAASRSDALTVFDAMGDRLAHLHVADGTGTGRDEHLVPGRGNQPCGEVLERLARKGFRGNVVVEANTRRVFGRSEREADLAEALAFTRLHLAAPAA
ncbi:MAG: AP endonuclease [Pseudonocardiales bacterium]|nr:MAG: AP endonuclease [Pseudonocardiales bacterium]